MSSHSSAAVREATPHVKNPTRTATIMNSLKRRAQAILNDRSIDPQSRAVIRYALEINDPWLARLVRCADARESIETLDFSQTPESEEDDSRIEALAEMICRAGEEATAALLVLMAALENSEHPKALANQAKQLAFARCGELNLFGIVDAQIASLENELLFRGPN